jgi:hypothetical protein
MEKIKTAALFSVLIGLGVISRLMIHSPNLSPIVGLSLFAGWYFRSWTALIVPVGILAISNIWLGHYSPFLAVSIYGSFMLPAVLGRWAKTSLSAGGLALASSCCFFILSNFAVWCGSGWYPQTLEGLVSCYVAAIPFFQYSLIGSLGSTLVIFGSLDLVWLWQANKLWLQTNFLSTSATK